MLTGIIALIILLVGFETTYIAANQSENVDKNVGFKFYL
jgi:hypothetical protein